MTDNIDETPEPDVAPKSRPLDDDPDGYTDEDVSSKDGYLDLVMSAFVGFKDEKSGSIGMTVTSNGVVVSGIVIGRSEWIKRAVAQLREGGAGANADSIDEWLNFVHDGESEKWDERDAQDLLGRARRFIHMRDVRILNSPGVNLPLWRGALKDITGWSLGSFAADTDD